MSFGVRTMGTDTYENARRFVLIMSGKFHHQG